MHLHLREFRRKRNFSQRGSNPLNVAQVMEFYPCQIRASAEAKGDNRDRCAAQRLCRAGASPGPQVTLRRMVSVPPSPKSP
jgi:hypothetical protein